jgi:hypothetical protein
MPSRLDGNSSTPQTPSNAFSPLFLRRFDELDEPITGLEADTAGPWSVEPVPGRGFGLFRAGERPSRGFRPAVTFPDRWLALLTAAVLPGTGREPLLALSGDPDPDVEAYPVLLDDGTVVGHAEQFDEALIDAVNVAAGLVRSPLALAFLLEAAGAVALERCGAILDDRIAATEAEAVS